MTAAPYDTLESALNLGRVRMGDAIASLGGDVLTDLQPFTNTMVNSAWRKLQAYLANLGYSRMKKPVVLYGLTAVTSYDPASWTALTWSSFFNGSGYDIPPTSPVLPQDFILPLKIWERQNGSNAQFIPMEQCVEALPDARKGPFNSYWYWENDTLYMPGSIYSMDLRLEYAAYLSDFAANVDGTVIGAQPVPIMRAQDALANYFCAEAALGRNDVDADPFTLKGDQAARMIFNREVAMKQRRPVSRRSFSSHRASYGIF
jgi:hypothetical protein